VFRASKIFEGKIMEIALPIQITALYGSILGILLVFVSLNVIRVRRNTGTGLGTAVSEALLQATRIHANFIEYVPMTLLLILMAEALGTSNKIVHGLGIAVVIARVAHAQGLHSVQANPQLALSAHC
jgi:uncharacterized membrane protein YecN with MAPEG domain